MEENDAARHSRRHSQFCQVEVSAVDVGHWRLDYWCRVVPYPLVRLVFWHSQELKGQFGDQFGSLNALFSGLAFWGVIVAITIQHRELRTQLQELSRSAAAQEGSLSATRNMIYAQAFKTALDVLQNEKTIAARLVIFRSVIDKRKPLPTTAKEKEAAKEVCRTFDVVGIMVKHGMLPKEVIIDNWGDSVSRTWDGIEKFVLQERGHRRAPELWDDYEMLAREARSLRSK